MWIGRQGTGDIGIERGCEYLAFMQQVYCDRGSGWACNERGITLATRLGRAADAPGEFERACALDFAPGCQNVLRATAGSAGFAEAPPPVSELPIVVRGSKGPVTEREPAALYALACERGWPDTCDGPPVDAGP